MKRNIYTLIITTIISLFILSGCSSTKEPVVKKSLDGKTSTTVVVEKDGTEERVTYESPYVSRNRTMTYDGSTDTTIITESEATVTLLGQWTDQGDCYTSERFGTVNLINRGELLSVSDFSTGISTETSWSINKESHPIMINTLKNGINCYNFHIHSQISTYQFFYTTNANTSIDDATQLINKAVSSFTFDKPTVEETPQPVQPAPENKVQEPKSDTTENTEQEQTPEGN